MQAKLTLALLAVLGLLVVPGSAPAALADDFRCPPRNTGVIPGNLIVPGGATCDLVNADVQGNVIVQAGATLRTLTSVIQGNVQADGFRDVSLGQGTEVRGNVQLRRGGTFANALATIGGDFQADENRGPAASMTGSRVGGSLRLEKNGYDDVRLTDNTVGSLPTNSPGGDLRFLENRGRYQISGNHVGGNVRVIKNIGEGSVTNNQIRQNLECFENVPAPVSAGNTASQKLGQCGA
jgi:hypothetical protein